MEYVNGVPITEYCDDRQLTVRERIELFMNVCKGVQHAHQRGIIHRDLKPSNVLVAEIDRKAVPKIIDFGVAKATTQALTDKTVKTVLGGWIGTPAYMSPEQAEITDDIDTRTDVYSLGVMLYELLTSLRPFDADTLDSAGFDELRRVIREVEPPRPSTRLSAAAATGEVGEGRPASPRALVKRLQGDLDWILMKALEKDKERRYGSPAELEADLERHLTNQPVRARPPAVSYRVKKFVRRHRLGVGAAAVVGISVIGGSAAALCQAVRATRAEEQALTEAERATDEAEAAQRVSDFLVELFASGQGDEKRTGDEISARELVDDGAARIRTELAGQPVIRARLMAALGSIETGRGRFSQAYDLFARALAISEQVLPPDDPRLGGALSNLASIASVLGKPEALVMHERSLEILEGALGAGKVEPFQVANAANNLGAGYARIGRLDDAVVTFERVVALREEIGGPEGRSLPIALINLGMIHLDLGHHAEAERILQRSLTISEKWEESGAKACELLGVLHRRAERYSEAESYFERAMRGREHLATGDGRRLRTQLEYAHLRRDQGRSDEARSLYRQVLESAEEALGREHEIVVEAREQLAALQPAAETRSGGGR